MQGADELDAHRHRSAVKTCLSLAHKAVESGDQEQAHKYMTLCTKLFEHSGAHTSPSRGHAPVARSAASTARA